MAKFVVDRRTWFRGKGPDDSKLLRLDGQKCCIGFVAEQCKLSADDITDKEDISCIRNMESQRLFPSWMYLPALVDTCESVGKAYEINDDESISDAVREESLKAIFAGHGDEIEFIN